MDRPSPPSDPLPLWRVRTMGLGEFGRYLLYLRVPLLFLGVAGILFLTEQVRDVLLAMALEPDWAAFLKAAFSGGVFGVLLWFASRRLSNLRWMRPTREPGVWTPKVRWMPPWIVWWLPRWLGIAPLLMFAGGFALGVGWIGSAPPMALALLLEAAALMGLLYLRTRGSRPSASAGWASGLGRVAQALRVRSGERDGLFSPRAELLLMGMAWANLALITVPIARAAYGPFGGGITHLYALLVVGAGLLALWRWGVDDQAPPGYWRLFGVLLAVGFALPFALNLALSSGVVVPRAMGSIAILFDGLAIILVFASTLFAFSVNSGVPLVALLLVAALALNSFRVNDNHAVRLLPAPLEVGGSRPSPPPALPSIDTTLDRWLDEHDRREAIEAASQGDPWPIYVVSAQGGGVFAAYHAAKALAVLSREVPDFPRHAFALSGVSGGSVGVALYVNALDPSGDNSAIVRRVDRVFDADHLSPVLAALMTGDATQRAYPWPVAAWDRSLGLELSFSDTASLDDGAGPPRPPISLETPFYGSQLAGSTAASPRPFLVLNTTEVASGRRFLLSPFQFPSDATFHAPMRPDGSQEVRTSTAAVMSARFPVITPYAFFNGSPSQRERRTVDGGFYDNSGAVTGQEILSALNKGLAERGLATKARVIPITIVNRSSFQRGGGTDLDEGGKPLASRPPKPLLSFSSLQALFATREARVAKTLADFGVRCGETGRRDLCVTLWPYYKILSASKEVEAKAPFSIPLGWTLSCQSRAFISQQLRSSPTDDPTPPCLTNQTLKVEEAGNPPKGFPDFATVVSQVRTAVERSAAPLKASPAAVGVPRQR